METCQHNNENIYTKHNNEVFKRSRYDPRMWTETNHPRKHFPPMKQELKASWTKCSFSTLKIRQIRQITAKGARNWHNDAICTTWQRSAVHLKHQPTRWQSLWGARLPTTNVAYLGNAQTHTTYLMVCDDD